MAREILKSIFGRHIGIDANGALVGRLRGSEADATAFPRIVYVSSAASTAVANTTTETEFDANYTMPAGLLYAGALVRIRYQGIATATNSTDTLAVKLYLGGTSGTALITHSATDVANNDVFCGEFNLAIRTAGASGTGVGTGFYNVLGAAGTATVRAAYLASTTIDTTAAQKISLSATWSNANAGNSCRLDFLSVEIA